LIIKEAIERVAWRERHVPVENRWQRQPQRRDQIQTPGRLFSHIAL
jgi:hypothetical protein